MVGPDGDVFFGVMRNPGFSSYRGWLLHFSADLQVQKLPGSFGWDYTAAVVPTNMVPSYSGPSSYLIFSKYNSYHGYPGGDGINRIALLDPNAAQVDSGLAPGLPEMREVMTANGCTPEYCCGSVYEWCINSAAVNPPTQSVFAPSEDGRFYRWNLALDSFTEVYNFGQTDLQPYVPTVIGPDGAVYAINGSNLYVLDGGTNVSIAVYSSAPDLRPVVSGQPVTFTAVVTNLHAGQPAPTGTVTFQDVTYGATRITNILAANVPLVNGMAGVTTSALAAGSNYLGNHFITAIYSGDSNFLAGSQTLVQKVHTYATSTAMSSSLAPGSSNSVAFSAAVSPILVSTNAPSGMVSFWDGANFLGQAALGTNGTATVTNLFQSGGSHALTASYASDTFFASSSGNLQASPPLLAGMMTSNGLFQLAFSNNVGIPFTVLGTTDVLLPLTNWTLLGPATEVTPGNFQFTDPQSPPLSERFYRVQSP